MDVKKLSEKINLVTKEDKIKLLKKEFENRTFDLKKWNPPKENKNWSHDHCELCNKEISNHEASENEGYTDEKSFYWLCKSCFESYFVR